MKFTWLTITGLETQSFCSAICSHTIHSTKECQEGAHILLQVDSTALSALRECRWSLTSGLVCGLAFARPQHAGIMFDVPTIALCPKLCWRNVFNPNTYFKAEILCNRHLMWNAQFLGLISEGTKTSEGFKNDDVKTGNSFGRHYTREHSFLCVKEPN